MNKNINTKKAWVICSLLLVFFSLVLFYMLPKLPPSNFPPNHLTSGLLGSTRIVASPKSKDYLWIVDNNTDYDVQVITYCTVVIDGDPVKYYISLDNNSRMNAGSQLSYAYHAIAQKLGISRSNFTITNISMQVFVEGSMTDYAYIYPGENRILKTLGHRSHDRLHLSFDASRHALMIDSTRM